MLKLDYLLIESVNGIDNLRINFNQNVNILCGPNGVGKTTILECISNSFRRRVSNSIRKSVNSKIGIWNVGVMDNSLFTERFEFNVGDNQFISIAEKPSHQLFLETNEFIKFDISERDPKTRVNTSVDREPRSRFDVIKHWLYRNYFEKGEITAEKSWNLQTIKDCFEIIDHKIKFKGVDVIERYSRIMGAEIKYINITLETPHGELSMDYLSSGYKACLMILLDIIRVVEKIGKIHVREFEGLILIDEIDLHLHPEWQSKILGILKWLVPKAQIIATTHSPHIVQSADPGEIIPLGVDKKNRTIIRELPMSSDYGYQGWTIEEVLKYVMKLSNPMSERFTKTLNEFNYALENEDSEKVTSSYKILREMLFQSNPLSTLLSIQAGELINWGDLE